MRGGIFLETITRQKKATEPLKWKTVRLISIKNIFIDSEVFQAPCQLSLQQVLFRGNQAF